MSKTKLIVKKSKPAPVHIKDIKPAKRNARKHNPRNIAMIEDSIQMNGTGRSILLDENNELIAGSGTVEAAGNVGITKLRVIDAQPDELIAVRRTNLTKKQKIDLAIADNRTNELSEWDPTILGELGEDVDLDKFFTQKELQGILSDGSDNESLVDNAETTTPITYVSYRSKKIPLTSDEDEALTKTIDEYVTETGTFYGLFTKLLGIAN